MDCVLRCTKLRCFLFSLSFIECVLQCGIHIGDLSAFSFSCLVAQYLCTNTCCMSRYLCEFDILVLLNLQHIRWQNCLQYEHINNDTNSPALGKCHPYFKVFSRLSKQLPFHLQLPFLPYQTHQWVMNSKCCFLCKSNRNLKTGFQCCSHTYPIHKDMPLTFWFMWVSLFLFCNCFFQWNSLV